MDAQMRFAKAVVALVSGTSVILAAPVAAGGASAATPDGMSAPFPAHVGHACAPATAGHAACLSAMRTDLPTRLGISPMITPTGFGPADLRSAYNLTSLGSPTQTVGIVDAHGDPNAESDLAVYRAQYGLPPCTTGNGCFRKVDQDGSTGYPSTDPGWAFEISLDLDMVSAICPNCHIVLVETRSNEWDSLGRGVDRAAILHANAISNSYGGPEAGTDAHFDNHPGIALTASTGDDGYGVMYPASTRYVTAVGGTVLSAGGGTRGWTETAWSGAGSGCSIHIALPGAAPFNTGCNHRAIADVSAVAVGVAVYDTVPVNGFSGWTTAYGTSIGSPIIASIYALAGNELAINPSYPYGHYAGNFNDVTAGSNGTCSTPQWCHARIGWDGPTGLGTPNGIGGF